ncbi:MAG TPA: MerR family DNA-binding protein [Rubrobacter sp.]|nr:MerR family DNA-binding protein [Rubrobacter sp.]
MTRGLLAKRAGIGPEAVRYYESIGLLDEPHRTQAGYRVYEEGDLSRLRFIQRAKELGFSLEDIRELIALRFDDGSDCSEVEHRAERRLADISERIRGLQRVQQGLKKLIASCRANPSKEACPIIEVLESEDR